ncbi:hypothetical protein JHK87_020429 [Glycine soja]|nr:hypothetical protein JHK87_020429 [Glycine soja]
METKEEIMLPSPSKGLANNGEQCSPGDDSGSFYMKLAVLFESSGLSLMRPAKQAGSNSTKGLFFSLVTSSSFFKGPLQKKRKSTASLPHTMDIKDGHKKTTEMSKDYSCNMTAGAGYVVLPPPSHVKETKKHRGQKILRLAIDAWRNMSTIEKKPYEEESKKNKEAMIGNKKEEKWHSLSGDNLVTSQPETDDSKLVKKATEKAPMDPSFIFIYN